MRNVFLLALQGVDENSAAYLLGKYAVFIVAGIIILVMLFFLRPKAKK